MPGRDKRVGRVPRGPTERISGYVLLSLRLYYYYYYYIPTTIVQSHYYYLLSRASACVRVTQRFPNCSPARTKRTRKKKYSRQPRRGVTAGVAYTTCAYYYLLLYPACKSIFERKSCSDRSSDERFLFSRPCIGGQLLIFFFFLKLCENPEKIERDGQTLLISTVRCVCFNSMTDNREMFTECTLDGVF